MMTDATTQNSGGAAVVEVTPTGSAAQQREAYLQRLLILAQGAVPADFALADLRAGAAALVAEQSFPTTRQEDWRFTDLSGLLKLDLQPAADAGAVELPETATPARLVLGNGRFDAALSDTTALPDGVICGSLRQLWADPDLQPRLAAKLAQTPNGQEIFTALNTTGFADGAVVWVPRNTAVAVPVSVVHMAHSPDGPSLVQPRTLVVVETGSQLTLVETFYGNAGLVNAVGEYWVDPGAHLTHVRLQRQGSESFHIGKTAVVQGADSTYRATTLTWGARLCRHNLEVHQAGAQTTTDLYGLEIVNGNQHSDTHSLVALNHPHGVADQLHKSIVDDRGHTVFNGRVVVPQAAQLTNASQLNRNLLLSDRARVDTKPQLEIIANDVKCAHGATVSQLSADEIFYLQSRGISREQAQRLLIYGFAMEILERVPVDNLRESLADDLARWT